MVGQALRKIIQKTTYGVIGFYCFFVSFSFSEARHVVRFHQKASLPVQKKQNFTKKTNVDENILRNMLVRTKRNRDFAYLPIFLGKRYISENGKTKKLNNAAFGSTPSERHYILDAEAEKIKEAKEVEISEKVGEELQKPEKREDLAGTYLIVLLGTSLKELMGHATLTVSYLRYGKFKPIVQKFSLAEMRVQDDRQIFIRLDLSKTLRKKIIAWKVVLEDERSGKTYTLESFVWKRLIRKAF